ncbi:MAG: DivIVA domain-containing protein [Acidimicrobiia bacterium]|nr:DivIVA domain-containing protein [Acidimicrobiia bacterium]
MDATSVETHQFEEAKRGFEIDQVKAFQRGVAATLRQYEKELADVQGLLQTTKARAAELEVAEEAVKRTFVAAGLTKQQMIEEAERDTAALRAAAEKEAASVRASAQAEADSVLRAAKAAATKLRDEAEAESARLRSEAHDEAEEMQISTEARRREIEKRFGQLRVALASLEDRLRVFADDGIEEINVTRDLMDLETKNLDDIEAFQDDAPKPAEKPVATPVEAVDAALEELDEESDDAPRSGRDSFYTRREGLKQRLAETEDV